MAAYRLAYTCGVSTPGMLETVSPSDRAFSGFEFGDHVAVFTVTGSRDGAGSDTGYCVHTEVLAARLAALPDEVRVVVFADPVGADTHVADSTQSDREAPVATVEAMLSQLSNSDADAVVSYVMATEAVKLVDGDVVVSGIDRSRLVAARRPQVMDRGVLQRAVETDCGEPVCTPSDVVVRSGASVALFEQLDQSEPKPSDR